MISTRHEQATTYMADGYARTSGRPGVALVVPGVGLYNAASGLATAYARSSPVLVIAGQIPRAQIGKNLGGIHEISDQPDVVRPVTKWRRRALTPREIPDTVREAFRQMRSGRWGVTQSGLYARTHYPVHCPKTYIDSGYTLNLGYSFPTALGAKVANPERPVVCVVGDGGFMFNASELATAMKYGINTTTIVFNNSSYGNVARDLDESFGGAYATDLANPDFVKFAESFGAVGMRADDPMELETLIPLALERQAPVVIDVPIGHIPLPRSRLAAHLSSLPWTRPQDGLIER